MSVMYETTYGEKYAATKDLGRAEIAKLIRGDIKAAVKAGDLPPAKYSVRKSSGNAIVVTVSAVAQPGFTVWNPDRLRWQHENPHTASVNAPADCQYLYAPEARDLLARVEAIVAAYNYDGSDIQSDYFNVRFYSSVTFDWQWVDAAKESEMVTMFEGIAAEARAARDRDAKTTSAAPSAQAAFLAHLGVEAAS